MNPSMNSVHISLLAALEMGPPPKGRLAVPVLERGSIVAELYTPKDKDRQSFHTRDELYVVCRGQGLFFYGVTREAVEPGSLVFVRAGQIHRFDDFTEDFALWVFFFGPEGGEITD